MTRRWLWVMLRPPSGCHVRRLVAYMCLAVALPRLPGGPGASTVHVLRFLPPEAFGWLMLAIGIGLLATLRSRMHPAGRIMALLAFVSWMTLAAATASATSLLVDLLLAYALLGEIVTQTERGYECD